MNQQAVRMLLMNRLRLLSGTLRHTWQSGLILLLGALAMVYQLFFVTLGIQFGIPAAPEKIRWTLLAFAVIQAYRIFFHQTPVFRMEAATLLLTYNTHFFALRLSREKWGKTLFSFLIGGTLAFLLNGFEIDGIFLRNAVLLSLYQASCIFFSWIVYHSGKHVRWYVLVIWMLCSTLLLQQTVPALGLLGLSAVGAAGYCRWKLNLNIPKYYDKLRYLEAAQAALSHNDTAQMLRMAEENRSPYVTEPFFQDLHPTRRTAMLIKNLLGMLRMQKQILVLLSGLLLLGGLIRQTSLFAFLPLLDQPNIREMAGILCAVAALSAFFQQLIKQSQIVSDKRKKGLSLPFITADLAICSVVTATFFIFIFSLAAGVVYSRFTVRIFVFWLAATAIYGIECCTVLFAWRFQRAVLTAVNLLLIIAIFFFLA